MKDELFQHSQMFLLRMKVVMNQNEACIQLTYDHFKTVKSLSNLISLVDSSPYTLYIKQMIFIKVWKIFWNILLSASSHH